MKLLEICDLHIKINTESETLDAVNGANLTLNKGEILAVAGESGSGKSMMCKGIMNLLPSNAEISSGKIEINGSASMIFQDPMTSLDPTLSIGKQIGEAVKCHNPKLTKSEIDKQVVELLNTVGIDRAEERVKLYPYNFSGGMRQRVVIAIALAMEPDIIIADEPTTALDVAVQARILDLFRNICRQTGASLLLVTHDLSVVKELADRVAIMHGGKVIETGSVSDIFERPREEYTRALIEASSLNLGKKFKLGDVLLDVRHLHHSFKIDRKHMIAAVDDVSLTLRKGEILGIVGESGSGKSTLLKCIMNLYKIQRGEMIYRGVDAANHKEFKKNRRFLQADRQIIMQDSVSALNHKMKVWQVITEPLKVQKKRTKRNSYYDEAKFQLKSVGLNLEYADRYPSELSGGERQRVAIARALTMDPGLLACDEPVSSLDMQIQAQIITLLRHMRDEHGCSILFVTHDLRAAGMLCDRIAVMNKGKIIKILESSSFKSIESKGGILYE